MSWPALYCPIPPVCHPLVEQAQQHTVDWLTRFGLAGDTQGRDRLAGARTGLLAGFSAPGCAPEWLNLLADVGTWYLAFDDECDHGPHAADPAALSLLMWSGQRALETPTVPAEPRTGHPAALRDLRDRLAALAPPALVREFAEGVRACFLTELVRTAQSRRPEPPTFDESLATRVRTSSPAWAFPLLWGAAGCQGPAGDTFADPRYGALLDLTASLINWDNDFHSHHKDRADPGNGQNLIAQTQRHLRCTEQQAVSRLIALRNEVMALFLRLRAELAVSASVDQQRFLGALGHYLRGNLDWHEASGRYATTGIRISANCAGLASDPRLRTPAIAWWWDQVSEVSAPTPVAQSWDA